MKNQPKIMKNNKSGPGTMKNQPGTMKTHPQPWKTMKNQPGTMKNHENPWKTKKNQPGTMKNREQSPGTMENHPRTMKNREKPTCNHERDMTNTGPVRKWSFFVTDTGSTTFLMFRWRDVSKLKGTFLPILSRALSNQTKFKQKGKQRFFGPLLPYFGDKRK